MDFNFSEEHIILREAIQDFVQKEIVPLCPEAEEKQEFPLKLMRKMGELGYLGIGYPSKYGGGDMGKIGECILQEEVGRFCPGIGSAFNAQMALGTSIFMDYGTEEQKQRFLVPAIAGKNIACCAITEANAGSDLGQIETTIVRDGDHYIVNGSKIFTSEGPAADSFVVLGYTDKSKRLKGGLSAVVIEKGTPGLIISRKLNKLGMRAEATGEEAFENCRIPVSNLIGKEGDGFKMILRSLTGTRITCAARSLGMAQGAFDLSLDYSKQRVQFGQPISSFQAVKFKLGQMATQVETVRWLLYRAAWLYDNGKDASKEAAMVKLYSGNVVMDVSREAMHVQGGYGLMMESNAQLFYRDAPFQRIVVGTDEVQLMAICYSLGI